MPYNFGLKAALILELWLARVAPINSFLMWLRRPCFQPWASTTIPRVSGQFHSSNNRLAMDPVSAIGVASSVITFVELAYSFLSTVYSVYGDGQLVEHDALGTVSTAMRELSSQLISEKQFSQRQEDVAIVSLATQCHQLAVDIARRLSKSKGGKGIALNSIKAALKIICSKDDIVRLQKALDGCRAQLHLQLTVSSK
jgi:hypothetical protein